MGLNVMPSRQLLQYLSLLQSDINPAPVRVSALPTAQTAGAGSRRFVNDATGTTFGSVVVGGGGNAVPVYSDGTDWRIG